MLKANGLHASAWRACWGSRWMKCISLGPIHVNLQAQCSGVLGSKALPSGTPPLAMQVDQYTAALCHLQWGPGLQASMLAEVS